MSRDAHRFILRSRSDAALRARIADLGSDPAIADLLRLAAAEGFDITESDLRAAHRQDWTLRWCAAEASGANTA